MLRSISLGFLAVTLVVGLLGSIAATERPTTAPPANGEQRTGELGSPAATTTIDGR